MSTKKACDHEVLARSGYAQVSRCKECFLRLVGHRSSDAAFGRSVFGNFVVCPGGSKRRVAATQGRVRIAPSAGLKGCASEEGRFRVGTPAALCPARASVTLGKYRVAKPLAVNAP